MAMVNVRGKGRAEDFVFKESWLGHEFAKEFIKAIHSLGILMQRSNDRTWISDGVHAIEQPLHDDIF